MNKTINFAIIVFVMCLFNNVHGQKHSHYGSIGFHLGPSFPIARLASDEVGKGERGFSLSGYGNYNFNKKYSLNATLLGEKIYSGGHSNIIKSRFPNLNTYKGNEGHIFFNLSLGMLRRFYFWPKSNNNFFVSANMGIELNMTIYDIIGFYDSSFAFPKYTTPRSDNNLSPVFMIGIGHELFLSRYFSFNSKINYSISNLGIETVSYSSSNGSITFDPVDFGIAQRISFNFGIAFHLPRPKVK